MGLRSRTKSNKSKSAGWDSLPWTNVDTSESTGLMSTGLDDAMFFGLEEIDGNLFASSLGGAKKPENEPATEVATTDMDTVRPKQKKEKKRKRAPDAEDSETAEATATEISTEPKTKKKGKTKKEKRAEAKENAASRQPNNALTAAPQIAPLFESNQNSSWGEISLHAALVESLRFLNFESPTNIQAISMPGILTGSCDVVGSSETGSGKTLAFGLPIIHALLHEWEEYGKARCPFALILAPTRELAMQISSVLQDTCQLFKSTDRRIEVVNVVGGMSEHKQKRQLDGTKGARPVHIMVATPGRLCELMTNSGEDMAAFANLSSIRYLVIDEADRMVEEGHFPELYRIFSRIRDHEKLVQRGVDPVEALRQARRGVDEEEADADGNFVNPAISENPFEDGMDLMMVPAEFGGSEQSSSSKKGKKGEAKVEAELNMPIRRQTLLFSATLLGAMAPSDFKKKSNAKAQESNNKLKAMNANELICGKSTIKKHLPTFLTQLLEAVAVQHTVRIFDASSARRAADAAIAAKATAAKATTEGTDGEEDAAVANMNSVSVAESLLLLPSTLQQYEIRAPMEEKDAMAYYFLSANPSRVLVFVNSIKTARRLDGLLRALGLNCRTVHSQLQQRQRLRALDTFRSSPVGVLVATDIAARGLDIPKVQFVVHYDSARSVQVYVHRSGRTARASAQGTTISLVAPQDEAYHKNICQAQGLTTLPPYKVDLSLLPDLRTHVALAKKIFTKSFVLSQKQKSNNWLRDTARGTDLDIEDDMLDTTDGTLGIVDEETGEKISISSALRSQLEAIDRDRQKLKVMVARSTAPASGKLVGGKQKKQATHSQFNNIPPQKRRKGGAFIVVAK